MFTENMIRTWALARRGMKIYAEKVGNPEEKTHPRRCSKMTG
jgi:hypothetical protein